jgi:peptide deformylase
VSRRIDPYNGAMSAYSVRVYGDPVLKQVAREVDKVDGSLVRLVEDMVETMYDSEGAGLAAPQVGVQKRLFVYDVGEGPQAMINPTIVETDGEWYHDEGCLSIPGLRLGIVRPDRVHVKGFDVDGNEVSLEADEFLGRVFLHEVDHLDGVLMVERLEDDMRKQALRVLRDRALGLDTTAMEAKLVSAGSDREI